MQIICQEMCSADKSVEFEDINVVLTSAFRKEKLIDYVMVESVEVKCDGKLEKIRKEDLIDAQKEDKVIAPVYKMIENGMKLKICEKKCMNKEYIILMKQTKKLSIEEGVLVRKTAKFKQIVLPQKVYYLVYSELHEKLAHLVSERLLELARRRFYWQRMKKSIENFIRKRCRCIISKKPNVQERTPMVPITLTFPFELVSIDYRVDMSMPWSVCDHFIKFVQMYASKIFNESIITRKRY